VKLTAMPLSKNSRIAVIGGGILGLTLAYKLSGQGYQVKVLEWSPEFGGLASGLHIAGSDLEKYYHHVFKSDTHFLELLKELKLDGDLQWLPGKMGIFLQGKSFDFSSALDILKFSPLSFPNRIRLGIVSFYLQKFATYTSVKDQTALNWCLKYFGKAATRVIWEPLLYSKFGENAPQIAMTWLLTRIHDRASSRSLPWQDEKLGYLKGSMTRLIKALVASINKNGSQTINNCQVISYRNLKDKHEISFQVGSAQRRTETFDRVVVTIPPQEFIKLFQPPANYQKQLTDIQFMGAVCMVLKLKHSVSKYYWLSINDPEAPFVAAVEHTNLLGPELFKGSSILYLGKYLPQDHQQFRMADQELLELYIGYLKKINPEFDRDWITEFHIFKARTAQHLVPVDYKVLDYSTGIPGLYFAHFAQIFPHDRGTNYAIAQAQQVYELLVN
jgi:protoporphyrinogen oxidase